ncbi:MAG TPA: hypothetical protein VFM54_08975 [Micromonosporaceae bacterium]|nr:hypothetical protein [Micromonosporaceae bacterium]
MRNGLSFLAGVLVGIVLAVAFAFGAVALVNAAQPSDLPKSEVELSSKLGSDAKPPPNYGR